VEGEWWNMRCGPPVPGSAVRDVRTWRSFSILVALFCPDQTVMSGGICNDTE
jgi:hypothetical protein